MVECPQLGMKHQNQIKTKRMYFAVHQLYKAAKTITICS